MTQPTSPPLQPLLDEPVDWRFKGFPACDDVTVGTVGDQGWAALDGDLPLPALLLKAGPLERNLARMAAYCTVSGALLAPHGKTTMSPQLAARQLAAGAWGITVANVAQARVFARFGVQRLLVANEVVQPAELRWIVERSRSEPSAETFVLVDSVDSVRRVAAAGAAARPIPVLLELGYPEGRAGYRDPGAALEVARVAAEAPEVDLLGVEGFEGALPGGARDEQLPRVRAYLAAAHELLDRLSRESLVPERPLASFGGSMFFDEVVAAFEGSPAQVVLRSGCYLTHDNGHYAEGSPWAAGPHALEPALELWGPVLSRPTDDLAIVGFGRRDAPYDAGLPLPLHVRRAGQSRLASGLSVLRLNDQHAHLRVAPGADLRVGDAVGCGISHPCSAFDRWPLLAVVDDDYRVVGAVRTFF